ncbi:hypothetical protein ACER0C_004858 [Sarotherodon galilaeus]
MPTWRLAANADTSSSVFIVIFVSSEEISGPGEDSQRGPVSGCLSRSLSRCCPVREAGLFLNRQQQQQEERRAGWFSGASSPVGRYVSQVI